VLDNISVMILIQTITHADAITLIIIGDCANKASPFKQLNFQVDPPHFLLKIPDLAWSTALNTPAEFPLPLLKVKNCPPDH